MNTTSNATSYNINLCYYDEPTYDWDELVCIYHQLYAINKGWAWPIKVFVVKPIKHIAWDWNDPKEDIYKITDGEPMEHGIKSPKP